LEEKNSNRPAGADYSIQKLILGTHTSDNEQNYLMIAQARLPAQNSEKIDMPEDPASGGFGSACKDKRFRIETEIPHEGEVNRARYMPLQHNVIATNTSSGEVHIYDYFRHPTKPEKNDIPKPELRLVGQNSEGYGLAWNTLKRGILASGGNNGKICIYDVENAATLGNNKSEPIQKIDGHIGAVEDISFHKMHQEIYGSVGDDKVLNLWDLRGGPKSPIKILNAHEKDVLSLDFNPFNEYLLATGSTDHTIGLWDMRNLAKKVHILKEHKDEVVNVSWSPFKESVIASGSNDRRILIWDLAKIGQKRTENPPELLFVHGGHTSKLQEMSWNPNEEFVMASVSGDNDIQIWQVVFLFHKINKLG